MNYMHKTSALIGLITIMIGLITIVPHSALAHKDNNYSYSNTQSSSYNNNNGQSSTNYDTGNTAGWYQAQTDWNSGQYGVYSYGNNVCPDGHSKSYCNGFHDGYTALWKQWIYNQEHGLNFATNQDQTSGINNNIKGNNNQVTNVVNQGQADNSGNGGGGGSSGGGNGDLPTCRILCSVIK